MENLRIKRIKDAFEYYRRVQLNKGLFNPQTDGDIINELALSETACELETDRGDLRKLLGLYGGKQDGI